VFQGFLVEEYRREIPKYHQNRGKAERNFTSLVVNQGRWKRWWVTFLEMKSKNYHAYARAKKWEIF